MLRLGRLVFRSKRLLDALPTHLLRLSLPFRKFCTDLGVERGKVPVVSGVWSSSRTRATLACHASWPTRSTTSRCGRSTAAGIEALRHRGSPLGGAHPAAHLQGFSPGHRGMRLA
jgi:hypothetical protein